MTATTIDLPPHTEGTTWPGIDLIGPVVFQVDEEPESDPPALAVEVLMQFRRGSDTGDVLATFRWPTPLGGELPLIMEDDGLWRMNVPPPGSVGLFPAVRGTYYYALKVKDADGIVWPVYQGVLPVVTSAVDSSLFTPDPAP